MTSAADWVEFRDVAERSCRWCGSRRTSMRPPHYGFCCESRRCRFVAAYFDARATMRSRWFGPLVGLYHLAHLISVMAQPTTPRQREFSKRFAHRRGRQ